MTDPLVANCERMPDESPLPSHPPVAALDATAARAEVDYWRDRALFAEATVSALREQIRRYRVKP